MFGVRFPAGAGDFSLRRRIQTGSGPTHPTTQWEPEALSLGVKRVRREADYSPPSSAELKNAWSYTSTRRYAFMEWCSITVEGQLYL